MKDILRILPFLFVVFSYQSAGAVGILLGYAENSRPFMLIYRSIYVFVMIISIAKSRKVLLNQSSLPLLLFWAFYSFRFIWDWYIGGEQHFLPDTTMQVFLGVTILPICTALFGGMNLDPSDLKKIGYASICVAILIFVSFSDKSVWNVVEERGRTNILLLNPIAIGEVGCYVLSVGCALLIGRRSLYLSFTNIALGLGLVFLGGSRGPIIAATFVCFFFLIIIFKTQSKQISIIFIAVMVILCSSLYSISEFMGLKIFDRFVGAANVSEESASIHMAGWKCAWNQFLSSPIWGDYTVMRLDHFFPHNLILDVLMSTGCIGFILLALTLREVYNSLWHIEFGIALMLAGIIVSFLINALFAGGLFTSTYFSILMAIIAMRRIDRGPIIVK